MRMYSSALGIKWEFHLLHFLPNTAHTHGKKKKKKDSPVICCSLITHLLRDRQKGSERKEEDMEGERKEINWERGRGRSQRPCDGRWHRSSACGQGKQLKMKQTHRQGSVCRCPLAAPLAFIPHPLPHCPASPACYPPIRAQGGGGTVGTHQSVFSVRGSGLMLAQHRGAQKKAGTAS